MREPPQGGAPPPAVDSSQLIIRKDGWSCTWQYLVNSKTGAVTDLGDPFESQAPRSISPPFAGVFGKGHDCRLYGRICSRETMTKPLTRDHEIQRLKADSLFACRAAKSTQGQSEAPEPLELPLEAVPAAVLALAQSYAQILQEPRHGSFVHHVENARVRVRRPGSVVLSGRWRAKMFAIAAARRTRIGVSQIAAIRAKSQCRAIRSVSRFSPRNPSVGISGSSGMCAVEHGIPSDLQIETAAC